MFFRRAYDALGLDVSPSTNGFALSCGDLLRPLSLSIGVSNRIEGSDRSKDE